MKRRLRRWLILGLFLLGVVLGARYYLSSRFVAARVVARLEELYGGPVTIGGASVGLNQTVITDLQAFESYDRAEPWLRFEQVEADLSRAGAVGGKGPTRLKLHGVTVTLRFDAEGRLLTRLPPRPPSATGVPQDLPTVEVTGGKLWMVGPNGRELRVDEIAAELQPAGPSHTLQGKGRSAATTWTLAGWLEPGNKQLSVNLHSDSDVAVTQRQLEALPFVPPATWREVHAAGTTTVVVALAWDWATPRNTYRVELRPRGATVHVTSI